MTDGTGERRLPGGADEGAVLVEGTVRRRTGPWTPAVHRLLAHLEAQGFDAAPRARGCDERGREVLSYLPGHTVGDELPWPAWVHTDDALRDVGRWLRCYHDAVADLVPPPGAQWREGGSWRPGMLVGYGDPAPYNAVWDENGLVGFVDWDNAGPTTVLDDLAWVAFAWTPLHAADVVAREGFAEPARRGERLRILLGAYGWTSSAGAVVDALEARLTRQVTTMRAVAAGGDEAYRAMVRRGQDRSLERARDGLRDVRC